MNAHHPLASLLALLALTACSESDPLGGDGGDDDGATDDGGTGSGTPAGAGGATGAGGAPAATTGSTATSTTATGATTSSSSSSGGDPSCSGIFGGACGACLEGACCSELAECDATPGCVECSAGNGPEGCEAAPAANALFECAWGACQDECFESGGSGGSGSGGGGGGFDLVNCTGPASTVGTVLGVTPDPTLGYVWPDPAGSIAVALYPSLSMAVGDVTVGVYFFAQPGQLDYPPNGTVGCAILEATSSSWSVIDTSQLCEVHLTALQFASAEGSCDGIIEGTFQGIFSGNEPLAGAFSLPLEVAESQISAPSCQPPNGPCSQNADCCTQSCSMFLGVCN